MSSKINTSLIVQVMDCVPVAEYQGEAYTQSALLKHNNQEWYALDVHKQVDPTYIGMECRVELIGVFGKLMIQIDSRKSIEALDPDSVKLHGEIAELEVIPAESPNPHTDINMVIDVGTGAFKAHLVNWPSTSISGDFIVEDLKRGLYIIYMPARIDFGVNCHLTGSLRASFTAD